MAMFAFTGTDTGAGVAGFECAVDVGVFVSCASGDTFGPLAAGGHLFAVRAVDAAGNRDQTPATFASTIDTTPMKCDADRDGDIDTIDLTIIRNANGQIASGPDDPRDGNRDGAINIADVRFCQLRLTPTAQ